MEKFKDKIEEKIYNEASDLLEKDEFCELKKTLEVNNNYMGKFWYHYFHSLVYENEKQFIKAIDEVDKAYKIKNDFKCLIKKGQLLLELNNYDEALECFNYALDKDRNNNDLYWYLGEVYLRKKNVFKALSIFKSGLEVFPNDEDLNEKYDYFTSYFKTNFSNHNVSSSVKNPWYGVKCLFSHTQIINKEEKMFYEERVLLIRANNFEEAIEKAEQEAVLYAYLLDEVEYLEYSNAFNIFEAEINDGSEIYSIIRESNLDRDEYLDKFYDTGDECVRDIED